MRVCNCVVNDFIKVSIVDEKVEEILGVCIVPKIFCWAVLNGELFTIYSMNAIGSCVFGSCRSSFFIAIFAAVFLIVICNSVSVRIISIFLCLQVNKSFYLIINIAE